MLSVAEFIVACEKFHILAPAQVNELRPGLRAVADAKSLARSLLERGWLTPFQANQLLTGRGPDLLLGSYVLLERIGEGGMGIVFKAKNWKLERLCALKVIRKEKLSSDDAVARFAREIEDAGKLNHPNIVRAYDAGEANGSHFFVMEYVEGVNLSKLVKEQGPVPPKLACEYIRQAALGLQHAHELGLVHRDIKPGNLLLARSRGAGTIKILDMGLALRTDGDEDLTSLTDTGALVGTIDYMSPEQSKSAHTADVRSDLYSLGCTLYCLLVGRAPFAGGSSAEKLLKHQIERPRPIEEIRGDVPPAVTEIAYKLMAKRPEDRFQTPAELAERLRIVLANANLWNIAAPPLTDSASGTSSSETAPLSPSPFWSSIVSEATAALPSTAQPASPVPVYAFAGSVAALVLIGLLITWSGLLSGKTPPVVTPPLPLPPRPDPVIALEGQLAREDPPDAYRARVFKLTSPHRLHEVKLEAGKSYQIDLHSDFFNTFLRVEDAAGVCLAVDDDGGEQKNSRLTFVATENARYRIIVTSTQGTGPYRLKLIPSPALLVRSDQLVESDKTHTVTVSPGTRYAIDLMSKEFDAMLRIADANGDLLDEADTGGVGKNARLFLEPAQAGTCRIVVTSPTGTGRGAYTLSVAAAGQAPVPQPLNGLYQGQLLASDPTDKLRGTQPCKIFTYQMSSGKIYQIDLEAIAFDPYLRVESPNGAQLAADDDSGEGLNSQIFFAPPRDGLYRIVATSVSTAGTGHFTLRITAASAKLVLNVNGNIAKKDTYRVMMAAGNKYVIETMSSAFDSVVTLNSATGAFIGRDDDSGGLRNARLNHTCTFTGEYQIVVTPYSAAERGPYRLTVRELSPERKP